MKIIDLRSDTKTLPTEEMRRAMYEAEVGDDAAKEDPTVNRLQDLAAEMMQKEAALFTTSGTMSNLIAILTHTHPGNEILLGNESHILWNEMGSASALGGVIMRAIPNEPDGRMEPSVVERSIYPKTVQTPPTTLLCLENTYMRCGGAALTPEYTSALAGLAHQHGLGVHLDGARIFNAATALDIPVSELAGPVDSVCFCLSKGLSAPVGSLLCGTQDFIDESRRRRTMIGGGMRQAGVIAAAGIVALQTMVKRLAEDHATARQLALGLAHIPGMTVQPENIQTNIVWFRPPSSIPIAEFVEQMNTRGIRFGYGGGDRIRAVTHRMVTATDIDEALHYIEITVRELSVSK